MRLLELAFALLARLGLTASDYHVALRTEPGAQTQLDAMIEKTSSEHSLVKTKAGNPAMAQAPTPAPTPVTWVLGAEDQSCIDACTAQSGKCSKELFHRFVGQIDEQSELGAIISNSDGKCMRYRTNDLTHPAVPTYYFWQDGTCYMTANQNPYWSCETSPSSGGQRVCACEPPPPATWVLGAGGQSCTDACRAQSLMCSKDLFDKVVVQIDEPSELGEIISDNGGKCTTYRTNTPTHPAVPTYYGEHAENQEKFTCFMTRSPNPNWSCERRTNSDEQRVCACEPPPPANWVPTPVPPPVPTLAPTPVTWVLGADGQSCTDACRAQSSTCSKALFDMVVGQIDEESKLDALILDNGGKCISHGTSSLTHPAVPTYYGGHAETQEKFTCYMAGNPNPNWSCETFPDWDGKRVCPCKPAPTPVPTRAPSTVPTPVQPLPLVTWVLGADGILGSCIVCFAVIVLGCCAYSSRQRELQPPREDIMPWTELQPWPRTGTEGSAAGVPEQPTALGMATRAMQQQEQQQGCCAYSSRRRELQPPREDRVPWTKLQSWPRKGAEGSAAGVPEQPSAPGMAARAMQQQEQQQGDPYPSRTQDNDLGIPAFRQGLLAFF